MMNLIVDVHSIKSFCNSVKLYADEIIICVSIDDIFAPNLVVKVQDVVKDIHDFQKIT